MKKVTLTTNRSISICAAVALFTLSVLIFYHTLTSSNISLNGLLFFLITFPLIVILMAMYLTPTVININESIKKAKVNKILSIISLIVIPLLSIVIMYLIITDISTIYMHYSNNQFSFETALLVEMILDVFAYAVLPVITIVQVINFSNILIKTNRVLNGANLNEQPLVEISQKSEETINQDRIKNLKQLLDSGAINKQEYDNMFLQVVEINKQKPQPKSALELKILKLKKMREDGLITNEEFTKLFINII